MATIADALRSKVLTEYRLPEHEGRVPIRAVLLAGELVDKVDQDDDLHAEKWAMDWGRRTRFEHMEQLLSDFRCDPRPLAGTVRRAIPNSSGVVKVDSPGLRLFGWVYRPNGLLIVNYDYADRTHGQGSTVRANIGKVLDFAARHGLSGTIMRGNLYELFPAPA